MRRVKDILLSEASFERYRRTGIGNSKMDIDVMRLGSTELNQASSRL